MIPGLIGLRSISRGAPPRLRTAIGGALLVAAVLFPAAAHAQMRTGRYVGDGLDNRRITGLGFQPAVVLIKADTGQTAVMRTSTMVGDLSKDLTSTTPLTANLIQTLDPDGFTIGNDSRVNTDSVLYYWTAFAASPNIVVSTYPGNGVNPLDSQNITSLSFSPVYLVTLPATARRAMHRTSFGGTLAQRFNGSAAPTDAIPPILANGFTVQRSSSNANDSQNDNGTTYHYVAWNAVAGSISTGSYTGDGTANRAINGAGFQPEWVVVQPLDALSSHQRSDQMASGISVNYLSASSSGFIQ